jgi:hypothetical protein
MSNESAVSNNNIRPVSPAKLSHAVMRTARLKEMVEWYWTVLSEVL